MVSTIRILLYLRSVLMHLSNNSIYVRKLKQS
jgi:hypothetical protein